MALHGNHSCWKWAFADIQEYLNQSDVLALMAPRQLIVETGTADTVFSSYQYPYAGDKQIIRRARVAGSILHFLHPLTHEWRGGILTYSINDNQTDPVTANDGRTLFDYLVN